METLSDTLERICVTRDYPSLYEFLKKHDPKADAFISQISKRTRIPAEGRLRKWADLLEMNEVERELMLDSAAVDRIHAASKRSAILGRGLKLLLKDLDLSRREGAKLKKDLADLQREIRRLTGG